jgi:hypothetical protein
VKNHNQQRKIAKAKQYAKTALSRRSYDAKRGLVIYHCYRDENGTPYKTRGYWDDVAFKMGSHYVVVLWTHPRYEYAEHLDTIAYTEASEKFPSTRAPKDWLLPGKKNYKRVGASRKKVVSYQMEFEERDGFFECWKSRLDELCRTSDYVQYPHINVKQQDYCRMVSICYPLEVVDEDSLELLANVVKSYLAGGDLDLINVPYGKDNYNQENPEGGISDVEK